MVTANEVPLIAGRKGKRFQIRRCPRSDVIRLSLEGDGSGKSDRVGLGDRADSEQQVMLPLEMPVDSPGEGRVIAEAEVFLKINNATIPGAIEGTRGLRIPPISRTSPFVIVQILCIRGQQR